VYATSYGQTEKIARTLAEHLRASSLEVTLADAKAFPAAIDPATFDGIIIGASIIARGHQPAAAAFIRTHRAVLERLPAAFFSVCASAGSTFERARQAARVLRDEFLRHAGWQPDLRVTFAGAVNFTRYGFLLRWYMKKASAMNGGSTDTTRDHEYTDWSAVEQFARDFTQLLTAEVRPAEARV